MVLIVVLKMMFDALAIIDFFAVFTFGSVLVTSGDPANNAVH